MNKNQKRFLLRIMIAAMIYTALFFIPAQGYTRLLLYIIPYAIAGWDIVYKAARSLAFGRLFNENFLMSLATFGAFAIQEYPEAVAVMLFYQIGELFESYAVGKSRQSIAALMDIKPDYANIESNGGLVQVDPETVQVGDVILIKAGEKIPLDGIVLEGKAAVNTMALTGESNPRDVEEGSQVISGCINMNGVLRVRVSKVYAESTVAKILDLVENASDRKAKTESFITRFSRYYTPLVVLCAVILAVLPPLILQGVWSEWLHRALIFLVVSCPCALVISIPLSFFAGLGGASKRGILVKGSNYLEALSQTDTIVFDKTGTLTKGTFRVTAVHPDQVSEEKLLELAALAESYSNHPISYSLREAYPKEIDNARVTDVKEISGLGVYAKVDGQSVYAGNGKLMAFAGIAYEDCELFGTIVHVAVEGIYAGHIIISDEIKEDSFFAMKALREQGIAKTVMLTGDSKAVGAKVGQILGIDEVYAELLPQDKVNMIERMLKRETKKGKVAFVGDGTNDAPVLARADIGIAMGALGSGAAIEAADIVLMDDKPSKIAVAVNISKKTLGIVKQNIVFALGIKLFIMVLGALGFATMWEAVFADVGVMGIAVFNAARAMHVKNL
ncbi:MAG: heavy metal translocating P-type ATPase [Christensenellales bacterium]